MSPQRALPLLFLALLLGLAACADAPPPGFDPNNPNSASSDIASQLALLLPAAEQPSSFFFGAGAGAALPSVSGGSAPVSSSAVSSSRSAPVSRSSTSPSFTPVSDEISTGSQA